MKYCPKCGASADADAAFCMSCGSEFPVSPTSEDVMRYHKNERPAGFRKKQMLPKRKAPQMPAETNNEVTPPAKPKQDEFYDGYYEDVPADDSGDHAERLSRETLKQIAFVVGGAAIIVVIAIILMNIL